MRIVFYGKWYNFASYTEDNAPCVIGKDFDEVAGPLEDDSIKLFRWFKDNEMNRWMPIKINDILFLKK